MIAIDLPIIWAVIIAFAVLRLRGARRLRPRHRHPVPGLRPGRERDKAMNSVAPVWDGNETWLVLGGGGLLAAFPLAYAVIMPALYAPIIAMLLALIFRGVAFEFRWRDAAHRKLLGLSPSPAARWWPPSPRASRSARCCRASPSTDRAYAGGWWDWLTPFSLLTGVALVFGYALLGATWLIMKTEGALQDRCYPLAHALSPSPPSPASRWSAPGRRSSAHDYYRALVRLAAGPVHRAGAAAGGHRRGRLLLRACAAGASYWPFLIALALFALGLIGLGISFYPYVVPRSVTIWDAAAPDSQPGLHAGRRGGLVPIILAYTGYSYWVFRGKVGRRGLSLMPSPRQWLWFWGLWAGGVGNDRDRRLRDPAVAYVVRSGSGSAASRPAVEGEGPGGAGSRAGPRGRRGPAIRRWCRRSGSRSAGRLVLRAPGLVAERHRGAVLGIDHGHFLAAFADIGDAHRREVVGRRPRDRRPARGRRPCVQAPACRRQRSAIAAIDNRRFLRFPPGSTFIGRSLSGRPRGQRHKCHTSNCATARSSTTRSTATARRCSWCPDWAATADGGARMWRNSRAISPSSCTITAGPAAARCRASPTASRRWPTTRCS